MQQRLPVSSTNATLPSMSKAKRDLLEKYLAGEIKDSNQTINRLPVGEVPQLSFGQERLWFIEQLMPGSAAFNVPIAVRLSAALDLEVLEQSLNEIVRRHDALRTTFPNVDGSPRAVIVPHLKLSITVVDLSSYRPGESQTSARRLASEEATRPFDLTRGPLIRVTLIKLGENSQELLVTMHHIISDGWSTVVFFQELSQLYEAFIHRQASPLPELPIQYPDYAAWQRAYLTGRAFEQQLSYWRENLGGNLPVLDLAKGRPRLAVPTHRGARESLRLSGTLKQAINLLSIGEGATLFMTLFAAFNVLLFRLTGLEDIIVGSPIASRPHRETEHLIGFFLNNLSLRTDLSGNPSFREVLARVRKTALDAYSNQDVPFEKIVEELNPDRNLSRTPIFQVFFNLLNFAESIQLPGLAGGDVAFVEAWSMPNNPSSQFDLTLYVAQRTDALELVLLYNADIFDREWMMAMLAQYERLLEQIVSEPTASISSYAFAMSETNCSSRVDLAQIEEVLSRHPLIKQNVVVERQDRPAEKRLVAYIVPNVEKETIISDLRLWVKQQLPDHTIPLAFVVLNELPLTANGKLDKRALPAPDGKEFKRNVFVPPRTTLELLLTKTWENVLDVRPIGVTDNFFDLGGGSLLAVRLFAQIEKVCGRKLPLTTLFQASTVEQLSCLLGEEEWSPAFSSLVPIQPGGSRPPLFCLHLALGHVLFYRDLARRLGSDQPVYAFQPQRLDNKRPDHDQIVKMVSHYINEMRALQPEGPYYLAGSSFGGLMAFEMAQQLRAQGLAVGLLAMFDTYAPGFQAVAPGGQALRYRVYRLMQRVNLHLSNLSMLRFKEKLGYVWEKAALVDRRVKGNIRSHTKLAVKLVADRWYHSNGDSVRKAASDSSNGLHIPGKAYVARAYPGCVTLFRASERPAGYKQDPDLGWSGLAARGLEVHEIPGYHGSIVTEPRVGILAERLRACLSQATQNDSSIGPNPGLSRSLH